MDPATFAQDMGRSAARTMSAAATPPTKTVAPARRRKNRLGSRLVLTPPAAPSYSAAGKVPKKIMPRPYDRQLKKPGV